MKLLNKSVLVGIAGALAALGNPSAAHAVTTISSGAECTNYYGSQASNITVAPGDIRGQQVWVTCPISRTDQNATAVNVTVHVYRSSETTEALTCRLASVEWNGTNLGANSASYSGSIPIDLYLNLPASVSSAYSHLGLLCYLPTNSGIYNYRVTR